MSVKNAGKVPTILSSKKIKRIHVNQINIRSNLKNGTDKPVVTVKQGDVNVYGHHVDIVDKDGNVLASIVYPEKPLACGARVWVETTNSVKVYGRK